MLQQPLHKGNVAAVGLVDFRCIPFAETVGADAIEAQVVADDSQLLLDRPLRNGKDPFCGPDAVAQTVVLNVLLDHQRHSEDPALVGLLLHDLQPKAVTVPDNIAKSQLQDIADPQAQVRFQHQSGGDPFIGAAAAKAGLHVVDNFLVLLLRQGLCLLVHSCLQ